MGTPAPGCNGTIYNTSRVNAACARHVPGADCAHNTPDRFALFCRNQFGPRKLTINALYHESEWDPAYEFGEVRVRVRVRVS